MSKTILFSLIICFCWATTKAQNEMPNPFAEFGYTPKMATLSKGKYVEYFDQDTIVRIGGAVFNTVTMKIMGFVEEDSIHSEYNLKPEIVSRWLSPDPLAAEYTSWSPYNFVNDNPIIYIDPDGQAVEFAGKGARRSVRQARRRSEPFNQAFLKLKKDEDIFVFNRNQTQNPNFANGAENIFDPNLVINGQASNFNIGSSPNGVKPNFVDEVNLNFRDAPDEQLILNGSNLPLLGTKRAKTKSTKNTFSSGTIRLRGTSNEQVGNNGFDRVVITASGQSSPVFEATLGSFEQGFSVDITKGFSINKDNSNGFGNRSKLKISVQNDKGEKRNPNAFGIIVNIKGN